MSNIHNGRFQLDLTINAHVTGTFRINRGDSSSGVSPVSNSLSTNFNGTDEYASTSGAPSSHLGSGITNKLTVLAWIKTPFAAQNPIISQWKANTADRKWLFQAESSGILRVYLSADGTSGSAVLATPTTTVAADTWTHVAFVYDGAGTPSCTIYVGGSAVSTALDSGAVPASMSSHDSPVYLGNYVDGAGTNIYYTSRIDEPAVYDIAMTADEVSEHYNSGTPIDPTTHSQGANCVGWWRMGDGDTSPTIQDQVNSNDMTTVNMSAGNFVSDVP